MTMIVLGFDGSYRPSLENGSDQLIVTLYTIYLSIPHSQPADPNPFWGTHCMSYSKIKIYFFDPNMSQNAKQFLGWTRRKIRIFNFNF